MSPVFNSLVSVLTVPEIAPTIPTSCFSILNVSFANELTLNKNSKLSNVVRILFILEKLTKSGAEIIIAINASPFTITKSSERDHVALSRVEEIKLPLIYLNRTGGQDELIFDGSSFALNYDGNKFFCSSEFKEEVSIINFSKKNEKWIASGNLNKKKSDKERLYKALVLGLRDYVNNNKFPGVVLGLSGGIDSALVAAIAADALGSENVQAIMLPSPFTGQES